MTTLGQSILLILLGWLLGLLGPTIIDAIKKRYRRIEISNTIINELKELQYRLTSCVFSINNRYGLVDHDLLKWALSVFEKYDGMYADEKLLQILESQLELTTDQLLEIGERMKSDGTMALSLRKFSTPFIDHNLEKLSLLPASYQFFILEKKSQVTLLNELIDDTKFYFKMTFDSSVSETNHNIARIEQERIYKLIADKSKSISLAIEDFTTKFNLKISI